MVGSYWGGLSFLVKRDSLNFKIDPNVVLNYFRFMQAASEHLQLLGAIR